MISAKVKDSSHTSVWIARQKKEKSGASFHQPPLI